MRPFRLLLCLFSIFFLHTAQAQINYSGREFFLALGNYFYPAATIHLASTHNATVTFHYTLTGGSATYTVTPYNVLEVHLNPAQIASIAGIYPPEVIRSRSLQISSDSNITVTIAAGKFNWDDDAMSILPVDNQEINDVFYLLGTGGQGGGTVHGASVLHTLVASEDSTLIEITPSVNTAERPAGVPFTISLNKGETYQIGPPYPYSTMPLTNYDISGTLVKVLNPSACHALSVYNTFGLLNIEWPLVLLTGFVPGYADLLLEQELPVGYWDTDYAVVSFKNNNMSVIRVLSSANNDTIFYNTQPVRILNQGEFFDTIVTASNPALIHSTYPVGVAQFMLSDEAAGDTIANNGDPDMLWNYSLRNGIRDAYFKAFPRNIYADFQKYILTIISKAGNINTITLNGAPLGSMFQPFPADPAMQYAYIDIDTGITYRLVSQDPVVAYSTEENLYGSYSHPLSNIDPVIDTAILKDTVTACIGDSVLLTAGIADSYWWSSGDLTSSVKVTDTGVYDVYEVGCHSLTHHIFYVKWPRMNSLRNVIKCAGLPLLIAADSGTAFQWSTGDTASFISVSDTGHYFLQALVTDSCPHFTITDFYVTESAVTFYRADTIYKCANDIMPIAANTAMQYLWYNGDTLQQITVADTGHYQVAEYLDSCRTAVIHSFYVKNRSYPPAVVRPDTTICLGDSVLLSSYYPNTTWTTGDLSQSIWVKADGSYTAVGIDSCGDEHTGTVSLYTHVCLERYCTLEFPSAFTPNNDGRNDLFRPIIYGEFYHYELRVYNRFGECVFNAPYASRGWDGTSKGMPCDLGVYYYTCTFVCPQKGQVVLKGDVTLIR